MNTQETLSLSPAHLFVGPHAPLIKQTKLELKKIFCAKGGCNNCITCNQIETKQHHGTIWIEPEKQYTLEALQPVAKQITFALEPGQHLFFVIQKADFLTPVCSNSLLKSVEEPPPGYHFIFLTERIQQILPTIRSRCIVRSFWSNTQESENLLFDIFKNKLTCDPAAFLKILTQKNPHERETIEHLDRLLKHWIEVKKTSSANEAKKIKLASDMIILIKKGLEKPPMPGSSKLFWKNFYLQVQAL